MRVWNLSEDLANLTRRSLRARDRDNKKSAFEGVPLVEILRGGGVKFGPDLRGPDLALHLVVEASGGYRRDGQPLAPGEGPLRVIVPGEKAILERDR